MAAVAAAVMVIALVRGLWLIVIAMTLDLVVAAAGFTREASNQRQRS